MLTRLKMALENLERDSPRLVEIKAPPSCSSIDGLEQQCKVAIKNEYLVGTLFIARLSSDNGYTFDSMSVEWKHALNLIKTFKKRTQ